MAGSVISQAQKDSADMNMTPMIDCVFQLIIFFMVVTEIKKSDDADLQLPRTRFVEGVAREPANRVVVSCLAQADAASGRQGDRIEVRGRRFDGPALQDYLNKLDRENRQQERRPPGGSAARGGDAQSHLFVKIRADARCEWLTVQQVQLACQNVGIYQLSYGAQPAAQVQ